MIKYNHSDILKNILSIFHDAINFTEVELQSIYQYLFKDAKIQLEFKTLEVFDTIQYLEDIIADHEIKDVEELERYFARKDVDMRVFIENVIEKLNDQEEANTMIIHAEGGLYAIDPPDSKNNCILFLLEYYQGMNERFADKVYSLTNPINQSVVPLVQWEELITFINIARIYFFNFREYNFLQVEFSDCLHLVFPFEFARIPDNWESIANNGLDEVMLGTFRRMSAMDPYFQFMVNDPGWNKKQSPFERRQMNRKVGKPEALKISKKPKTPLEEKISTIIQCAILEHQASQYTNYATKHIEESKLSNPLISINR